ncbi:formate dehydrogenase subunit gamma [Stappia sp. TSB10P1A]|uniref:formate dehydrogenase subunit gamma n=1 Tax=Stappia sp. TSB10P1A TaxID=2003585 RepID=UPI001643EC6E|nr:formate dehydrogenase subunit gamma [Stappia sp. TSB10P1A]
MSLQLSSRQVAERTQAVVEDLAQLEGPLLPILHEVQKEFGCVPDEALRTIAEALNLSRAEVHGVASFYHDFRKEPAGRHVLKICRAEACQSMGGDGLADGVRAALGIDWHETTPDGRVTLEPVYCLGLCSCAPAAMLDGELHGRLDETAMRELVKETGR